MAGKKERIMDLLRRGVITEEEALELLEKAGESTDGVKSGFAYTDKDGYTNHDVDFADAMKNTFNMVTDKLSDAFHGISKTVNDNVDFGNGFPKVKRTQKMVEKDIEGDFDSIKLAATSGKVLVQYGENAHVKVKYTIYGAIENDDIDKFLLENTTLDVEDDELVIKTVKRVGIDLILYLPEKKYDSIDLKVANGIVNVEKLIADTLKIAVKHGEITVLKSNASDLVLELINGTIKFDGNFKDSDISLVNGNILLTQGTTIARNLTVKNVNGDVKLAIPETLGLVGHVKTTFGSYKTRLRLDNPLETGRNGAAVVRKGDETLTFELETKSGTIWMKDTTQNNEN